MEEVFIPGDKPVRLLKWLIKVDDWIKYGAPLAIYRQVEDPSTGIKTKEMNLKSKSVGRVKKLLLQIGQVAKPGCPLIELESCSHPIVMKDMCAECGIDLRLLVEKCGQKSAHVSMVPNIPELKISAQQAEVIGKQDEDRLHKMKKLVLLVDLDQTLIHTTQNALFANLCKVNDENFYTFHLHKNEPTLYTKLRPHSREFLEKISELFELQIVTFGSRQYAHKIADFIDPKKKYFANRILSRDECINPMKKSGNLRHLFPCGDSMVCIIDDRDDVWNAIPNLILVKKYSYFPGAGDINSPDKAEKKNNNDKQPKKNGEVGNDCASGKVSPRKRKSDEDELGQEVTSSKLLKTSSEAEERSDTPNEENVKSETSSAGETEQMICEEAAAKTSDANNNSDQSAQVIPRKKDNLITSPQEEQCQNDEIINNQQNTDKVVLSDATSAQEGNNNDPGVCDEKVSKENHTDNNNCAEPVSVKEANVSEDRKEDRVCQGDANCQAKSLSSECSSLGTKVLEDTDDYLLYLQAVLTVIHKTYYDAYTKYKEGEFEHPPDLRGVVPFLRSRVLFGCNLVFTGVIPNNFKGLPHQHRAHIVAKQLGATVDAKVSESTTHLVGGKKGTAKYQECLKIGKDKIKFVSLDWLWACSERWERVSEKLFPIPKGATSNHPSREGTPPINQGKTSTSSEQSGPKTYNAFTGKLVKKVQDARFDFMVTEAVSRNMQHKRMTPIYSSLIDPEVAVPMVAQVQETKESSVNITLKQDDDIPSTSKPAARTRKPSMAEVMGIGYSLSTNDIEDMDKEVDDLMNDEDENSLGTMIDLPSSSSSSSSSEPSGPARVTLNQLNDRLPTTVEEDASEKSSSSSEEEFDHMAELLDHEMHYDEENDGDNLDTLD